LVFATLHSNDAASAPSRLLDIGVEPYLLAGCLQGVLAQRLVRKICSHCKIPLDLSRLTRHEQALLKNASLADVPLYQGEGCERCRFTGYHGRSAIGEVLRVSEKLREMIQRRCSSDQIKQQASSEGMRLLRDTALLKVKSGQTTVSEVLRVTQEDF
jgi:type II secretory ATPase GspE/PulE/Tfp pilus assembly ATPase PilB-like protein